MIKPLANSKKNRFPHAAACGDLFMREALRGKQTDATAISDPTPGSPPPEKSLTDSDSSAIKAERLSV